MITPLLKSALEPVVGSRRTIRGIWCFVAALCAVQGIAFAVHFFGGHLPPMLVHLTAIAAGWIALLRAKSWEPDYRKFARDVEARHPDLHALFLTAIEQAPDKRGELHFLQQRVVQSAIEETRRRHLLEPISTARRSAHIAAASAIGILSFTLGPSPLDAGPDSAAVSPAKEEVSVTPGDATIERGSGLVVLAKFHRDVPSEAALLIQPRNEPPQRIPLVKNLEDPVFGGGLPEVNGDLTYRIEYAGSVTRDFVVRVFEHPRLERADATLRFPDFAKLAEKKLPDTRRVSAVTGSQLEVAFHLNKPVKAASLVAKDGTQVPLAVHQDKPLVELRAFPIKSSAAYELRLEDADGRSSKVPAQFLIEALPNRRPELKFAAPKGDQRVSPIQEVAFRAEAWDDFGLARYGLAINVAGRGEQEIELGRDSSVDERRELAHLLKLEQIGVKADELVSWFLWAEDIGPDGKPRRTASDIFFAEVRPFEEIYRPGDGQEGSQQQREQQQGGGGGGQATKLADLQKQIITASWNLKRSEEAAEKSPTEKYLKDHPVVRDSQAEALKKATALGERLEDPKSLALIENVTREMQTALDQLNAAAQTLPPLAEAVAAEQSAYNALLKLASHEFRVVRQQRNSSSSSQGQQRNQQQLDQLEMKDEKQRYETKREAAPMQNEQQREELAILNRLKELAQRQQDINEKLKELQNALAEAKTESEKEEIKRQLKRLREDEQQMLADLDETRQKMEQSPQQAQLADERRKLDETRSEAQKAAEALEKNAASQALASGTRAARQLQEMRDAFRKKTTGQFNDEMRQMRTEARELAENEQAIAEKLQAPPDKPQRRSLDGQSEPEQLAQQLEKQQGALAGITEQMKRVSEEAEVAEPLLARELYETLRKNVQSGTGETLRHTQMLAERGYQTQAQKFEEKARQEIEELKTGVERAAESVLGNEAEALRQARAELDGLTAQLDREIARARPDLAETKASGEAQAPGETKAGDPSSQQKQQDQKPGEPGAPGTQEQTDASPARNAQSQNGRQAGNRPGAQTAQNGSPGQAPSEAPGDAPGSRTGAQTAQSGSPANQQGEPGQSASEQSGSSPGRGGGAPRQRGDRRPASLADRNPSAGETRTGNERGLGGGGVEREEAGPLTGENFADWSDRLRNVEEMLDDPGLRNEAARLREVAKGVRSEFKRHSVEPNWEMVHIKIKAPLAELRNRVTEELARRESKENLVPIDRDPVPTKYADRVRRYYEEIGRSR